MILHDEKEEAAFAAALVARLPKTMRIGAYEWHIKIMSTSAAASAQRYGESSSVQQSIAVQEWMPTRYKAVDTVVHEVMHSIFWANDIKDEDKEERTVCAMGSGWMAFLRDNPWFLEWIKSAAL